MELCLDSELPKGQMNGSCNSKHFENCQMMSLPALLTQPLQEQIQNLLPLVSHYSALTERTTENPNVQEAGVKLITNSS